MVSTAWQKWLLLILHHGSEGALVGGICDIIAVQNAFESQIANFLTESLVNCYNALEDDGSTSATAVAVRALKQLCLHYLAKTNHSDVNSLIEESAHSNNMTNALAALSAVVKANHSLCDTLLTEFDAKWRHDVLVMDKWFALQAMKDSATSISDIKALYDHPSFDFGNPNRVRAGGDHKCDNFLIKLSV